MPCPTDQVFDDFNQLSSDNTAITSQHAQFETLSGACAVVEVPFVSLECLLPFGQPRRGRLPR